MEEYCVCGHAKIKHQEIIPEAQLPAICFPCCDEANHTQFHTFHLDNLRYLEDLAKEKKLI